MKVLFAGLPKTAPADAKGQLEEIYMAVRDQYDAVLVRDGGSFPESGGHRVMVVFPGFQIDQSEKNRLEMLLMAARRRGMRIVVMHLSGYGVYHNFPMSTKDRSIPTLPYREAVNQLLGLLQ
jgi:hypothetical protein